MQTPCISRAREPFPPSDWAGWGAVERGQYSRPQTFLLVRTGCWKWISVGGGGAQSQAKLCLSVFLSFFLSSFPWGVGRREGLTAAALLPTRRGIFGPHVPPTHALP